MRYATALKGVFLLACVIAQTGCTTLPIEASTTRVVPADRIYAPAVVGRATGAEDGTVTILRDWGFGGGGCNFYVFLDAAKVAEIHLAEKLELHAPAGHHFVRVETASFLCAQQLMSQDVTLMAGEEQQYRIQMSWNGNAFARVR